MSQTLSLKKIYSGKVRDLYAVDEQRMLMVASDRLSAFDVILPQPIPDKGKILTAISNFWFGQLADILPNHLTGVALTDVVPADELPLVEGRSVVVKRLKPLPVEAIVRGYLAGTGWNDYRESGSVCGIALTPGLQQASKLPEPIFTPSSKGALGEHDQNLDVQAYQDLLGQPLADQVRRVAIQLYLRAAEHAARRGIIIADTKFEFGLDELGRLTLMDEVLTPDSSRFWPADRYAPGISPPSFDKQFVRDWLEASGWNKQPPAPLLPAEVLTKTVEKYREALSRLTGPAT